MPLKRTDPPALLVLEDGSSYHGYAFAGRGEVLGEVVFNTGMAGYQECLTDPSYKGQILVMTYPLIGNYGVNDDDMESAGIHLEGYIVKEYQDQPSNWRSRRTLKDFLEAHGRLGVDGIDTRSLTKKIRTAGAMRGILSTNVDDKAGLLERVRAYPGLVGQDMVAHVASTTPYLWKDGAAQPLRVGPKDRLRVVVLDCGVKYNILRHLEALRDPDQFIVNPVNSEIKRRLIPRLLDILLHFFGDFFHDIFNPGGMNAAVFNQTDQGKPGHLPPDWIKSG